MINFGNICSTSGMDLGLYTKGGSDGGRVCMITNQGHFYTISKAAKADTTNLSVITVT